MTQMRSADSPCMLSDCTPQACLTALKPVQNCAASNVSRPAPSEISREPAAHLDREAAAAWVWLDATAGRPAGGPHPNRSNASIVTFDSALDPETKLHLRTWWRNRLTSSSDLVTAEESASPARNTEVTRDAG